MGMCIDVAWAAAEAANNSPAVSATGYSISYLYHISPVCVCMYVNRSKDIYINDLGMYIDRAKLRPLPAAKNALADMVRDLVV